VSGLYSLSRKEGWRRYVEAPARTRPERLTTPQLAALSGQAREDYHQARHDWHANCGIPRTPQLAAVHDELDQIVAANRQDPDRVRGATVIDCVLSCQTRLGIIDDIHFINPRRRDGLDVSNHLKWLANELPVTFLYVGVGLAERSFFAEGLAGHNLVPAQTARRWTRLEVPPFEIVSEQGRAHWRSLLKATERRLVLASQRPGMLVTLADYLFERSSGHIGSFVTLIIRACLRAIRTGQEQLTGELLDQVRIDQASEQARQQLAAAFAHGRLQAAPATRTGPPSGQPASPATPRCCAPSTATSPTTSAALSRAASGAGSGCTAFSRPWSFRPSRRPPTTSASTSPRAPSFCRDVGFVRG